MINIASKFNRGNFFSVVPSKFFGFSIINFAVFSEVVDLIKILPSISNFSWGLFVPIPTLPLLVMTNLLLPEISISPLKLMSPVILLLSIIMLPTPEMSIPLGSIFTCSFPLNKVHLILY